MVVVCGRVTNIERAATKTVYQVWLPAASTSAPATSTCVPAIFTTCVLTASLQIEDNSGTLEIVQWVDEGAPGAEHSEGENVKVACHRPDHGDNPPDSRWWAACGPRERRST